MRIFFTTLMNNHTIVDVPNSFDHSVFYLIDEREKKKSIGMSATRFLLYFHLYLFFLRRSCLTYFVAYKIIFCLFFPYVFCIWMIVALGSDGLFFLSLSIISRLSSCHASFYILHIYLLYYYNIFFSFFFVICFLFLKFFPLPHFILSISYEF